MESINNLFSVINTEDATLIYGGSEFSNWVCEMFGKLCHGLTKKMVPMFVVEYFN